MKSFGLNIDRWAGRTSVLTASFDRLAGAVARVFTDSRIVLHGIGKIRRFRLVHFKKQYVQTQLFNRRGSCRQCGTCCNLLFTCPALTKQGKCLVYGMCRPDACKVFPIDQRDIEEIRLCGGHCGYRFENKIGVLCHDQYREPSINCRRQRNS